MHAVHALRALYNSMPRCMFVAPVPRQCFACRHVRARPGNDWDACSDEVTPCLPLLGGRMGLGWELGNARDGSWTELLTSWGRAGEG
jgi:hypothetical protein